MESTALILSIAVVVLAGVVTIFLGVTAPPPGQQRQPIPAVARVREAHPAAFGAARFAIGAAATLSSMLIWRAMVEPSNGQIVTEGDVGRWMITVFGAVLGCAASVLVAGVPLSVGRLFLALLLPVAAWIAGELIGQALAPNWTGQAKGYEIRYGAWLTITVLAGLSAVLVSSRALDSGSGADPTPGHRPPPAD